MTDSDVSGERSFERSIEHFPSAFAITRGAEHALVVANAAFRRLLAREPAVGRPIPESLPGNARNSSGLVVLLDRVMRSGVVERDRCIESDGGTRPSWCCTVWPVMGRRGGEAQLVIELRDATESEMTRDLQRDVAERMLLSALHERDVAADAESSRRRAAFLAAESRRLTASLDEESTLDSIARLALPQLGAWCIVDLIAHDGSVRRLAIVHPDPARRGVASELQGRWHPEAGDPFGAPAMLRDSRPTVISSGIDEALVDAAHDADTYRTLLALGVGPLLTVPLMTGERLVGAVTFVGGSRDRSYGPEDIELAEDLAARSAMALENARLHSEAVALKTKAEEASEAKGAFLGTMSHELRTPLNAIGGYVELIDLGLRGPVTAEQHADLARIRSNQQHLVKLVSDVLNLVRVGSGGVHYDVVEVAARELLQGAVALVEPLILEKQLVFDGIACDDTIVVAADRDKATQIVVNLLSNAIKFTASGRQVALTCELNGHHVFVRVADSGIGIPPDKLAAIFEPFVQVRDGLAGRDAGIGLGLSISRDLAHGMGGDITVESQLGVGSTFTLRLPNATSRAVASGSVSHPT